MRKRANQIWPHSTLVSGKKCQSIELLCERLFVCACACVCFVWPLSRPIGSERAPARRLAGWLAGGRAVYVCAIQSTARIVSNRSSVLLSVALKCTCRRGCAASAGGRAGARKSHQSAPYGLVSAFRAPDWSASGPAGRPRVSQFSGSTRPRSSALSSDYYHQPFGSRLARSLARSLTNSPARSPAR